MGSGFTGARVQGGLMAVLPSASRNALPERAFGLPGQRKYPVPDKSHARNALARASQQYNAGRLTAAQKAKIDAKAHAKDLGPWPSGLLF